MEKSKAPNVYKIKDIQSGVTIKGLKFHLLDEDNNKYQTGGEKNVSFEILFEDFKNSSIPSNNQPSSASSSSNASTPSNSTDS